MARSVTVPLTIAGGTSSMRNWVPLRGGQRRRAVPKPLAFTVTTPRRPAGTSKYPFASVAVVCDGWPVSSYKTRAFCTGCCVAAATTVPLTFRGASWT